MGIIGTIVIGFLAGLIARFLHPGSDPGGFIITTLLGIVGAIVATYLGQAVGWYRAGEGAGFIGAVVGAIVVLVVYSFATRRSGTAPRRRPSVRRPEAGRTPSPAPASGPLLRASACACWDLWPTSRRRQTGGAASGDCLR